jgi:hypothetical protein
MSKLRVPCFSLSLDGYAAGPDQSLDAPLGVGGLDIHEWIFPTVAFQRLLYGRDTGTTGIDNDFAARGVLLGSGESLFSGINMRSLGFRCVEHVAGDKATHILLGRT